MSVQEIMTNDPTGQALVTFAEKTAQMLIKKGLSRGQIRNIFTEVRKIEALWDNDPQKAIQRLTMLKPKLAYQAARMRQVSDLSNILTEAIDHVLRASNQDVRTDRFQRLVNLLEATLAYHVARHGRS